ncbi:MAG TPA: hypothetical protein VFR35_05350 [Actinoplanes sp.]|nr:hypothetical protein [Actinoplanes sp.]
MGEAVVGEADAVAVRLTIARGEGATVDAAARDVEPTKAADDAAGVPGPDGDAGAVGTADGAVLANRSSKVNPSSGAGGPGSDADGWTTMSGGSSSPSAVGATRPAIVATPAMTATTARATITSVPIGEGAEPPG